MTETPIADHTSRTLEGLAQIFRHFGLVEAPQLNSPLYAEFSLGIAADDDLLEIASHATIGQTPANMLFAATHYLLLRGERDPLRRYYPALSNDEAPDGPAYPQFREFVLAHRDEITDLVAHRRVQTNVIQRSVCLLPAFADVVAQYGASPLSLIEVGASAGLNLNWDRFSYEYRRDGFDSLRWGPQSRVKAECEVRGSVAPPLPEGAIAVASRVGVDINPIDLDDDDAVRWLRALIWPEHVARHERLDAAIDIFRKHPYQVRAGDAVELLPELLEDAVDGTQPVVFATIVLYQFSFEARDALLATMADHSRRRPVTFISMDAWGGPYSILTATRFEDGERVVRTLGHCNPHGHWLE